MVYIVEFIQTHETLLLWLASASIITFVATLIVVPLLVVRIPEDYFSRRERHKMQYSDHHPVVRGILIDRKECTWIHLYSGWDCHASDTWTGGVNDCDRDNATELPM